MSDYVKNFSAGITCLDGPSKYAYNRLSLVQFGNELLTTDLCLVFNTRCGRVNPTDAKDNRFDIVPGMQFSLQKRFVSRTTEKVYLLDGNGSLVTFNGKSNSYFLDSSGNGLLLHDANAHLTITDDAGNCEYYNGDGTIGWVKNSRGTVLLSYSYSNGKLSCVTDCGGRKLQFSYTDNKISRVQLFNGSTQMWQATLSYGSNQVTVTRDDGVKVVYDYWYDDFSVYTAAVGASVGEYNEKVIAEYSHTETRVSTSLDVKAYCKTRLATNDTFTFLYNSEANTLVQKQDIFGVKTRYQYSGTKLEYSYEADYTDNDDNGMFEIRRALLPTEVYDRFKCDVSIANQTSVLGELFHLPAFDSFWLGGTQWRSAAGVTEFKQYSFVLSGWFKCAVGSVFTADVHMTDSITSPILFRAESVGTGQWKFFSAQFFVDNAGGGNTCNSLYIFLSAPNLAATADMRITPADQILAASNGFLVHKTNGTRLNFNCLRFKYRQYGQEKTDLYNFAFFSDVNAHFLANARGNYNLLFLNNRTIVYDQCQDVQFAIDNSQAFNYRLDDYWVGLDTSVGGIRSEKIYKYGLDGKFLVVENKLTGNGTTTVQTEYNQHLEVVSDSDAKLLQTVLRNTDGLVTLQKTQVTKTNSAQNGMFFSQSASYADCLPASTTDTLGKTTTYAFDAFWGAQSSVTLPTGSKTTYTYDDDKQNLKAVNFSGSNATQNGSISYTDGYVSWLGQGTINFSYSQTQGRTTQIKQNSQTVFDASYADNGQTVTKTYPLSSSTSYTKTLKQDKYGRVVSLLQNDSQICEVLYDTKCATNSNGVPYVTGNNNGSAYLRAVKDVASGKTRYFDYSQTKLTAVKEYSTSGMTLQSTESFTYDSLDRLTTDKITSPNTESRYYYVAGTDQPLSDGRLSKADYYTDNTLRVSAEYFYDDFKRTTYASDTFSSYKLSKEYFYTTNDKQTSTQLSSVLYKKGSTTLMEMQYTYDSDGRLIKETDKLNSTNTTTYNYDSLGRLVREDNKELNITTVYTYDASGNVTSKKNYAYTTDTPTRLKSTTTFGYTNGNRLTYASGTVTSNSQGEPLSHNGNNYTWNYGKLSNVETSQGIYTYLYNAYGQRTRKTYQCKTIGTGVYVRNSNGNYTYDNSGRLLYESYTITTSLSTKTVILQYLYGSTGVVGCLFTIGGTTTEYSYLRNEKGDVVAVYNASGTKVGSYAYDAYGNCTVNSTNEFVTTYNPIRYRGYYCDLETGFYYCNTRYYNPFWCRWISMDSTSYADIQSVDGLNLFAYCNNDPINFVDPSGNFAISTAIILGLVIGGAIGAAVGGTIAYNVASNNGATGWELFGWTLLGVVGGGAIGAGLGAGIGYVGPSIGSFLGSTFQFTLPAFSLFGDVLIASTTITLTGAQIVAGVGAVALGSYVLYQRKNAEPRIRSSSKKEAYDKAYYKGGKKEPKLHLRGKYGPHYHPVGKYKGWHFYFSILGNLLQFFLEGDD